ncbi:glycosyltransferase [Candidatus Venteria ishoeyi]|uniref:glycosyltransferase n=1 Tax=Candidatus Venteria ishoeyi TaxID=1899563 RepID=UPI0025A4EC8E|nr:glycosyltransferase [Candidatus Venteria ishoeyi]MDM8546553.1 glycosyltransferase [Candidatus Venteria ishoeyi]
MFSIIMPLYNKAAEVRDSVCSVLEQTEPDFELLVIDDGSTDNSIEQLVTIQDPRLRLIQQPNAGVSAARNRGIQAAAYAYVAFIDADDRWEKDFLARIKNLIQAYPQAGAWATAYVFQQGAQLTPARIYGLGDKPTLIHDYFAVAGRGDLPLMASGVCIPRQILKQSGGFPEQQQQGEDQALWAWIGLRYPIAIDPTPCVHYQLSASNRVSLKQIPQQELPYSRDLQQQLNAGVVPRALRNSVARYIAGHLVHLAQLNVRAGRPGIARSLLADRRTRKTPLRRLKWWLRSYLPVSRPVTKARVLHLLNDTDMGGIKSVVDSLVQSSLAEDFKFEFVCINPQSWWRQHYQAQLIMLHYACNWRNLPGLVVLRLRNPRARIIIQEHHYTQAFERTVPCVWRFRTMLRAHYYLVHRVIAISQGQARWLIQQVLFSPNKLHTIPQSRHLHEFLQVPLKNPQEPLILAAYGRFHWQKGFDLLLEVMPRLPPSQFHLLLAGAGEQETQLKAKADKLEQVTYCGIISDVPKFLACCDVVLIPSRFEPFGLVCLEAKAAAKPVLVSNVDGLPEQAQGCGLVVNADDAEALYQALLKLPQQPLSSWGSEGRIQAQTAWDNYVKRWRHYLQQEINTHA